jgi:hypothetical protein
MSSELEHAPAPEITYRLSVRPDRECDSEGCSSVVDYYHYRRGAYSTYRCTDHALPVGDWI